MKDDSFTSEDAWVNRLSQLLGSRPDVIVGPGDDAAVIRRAGGEADVVYTTDAVIESIHFEPGTDPERIGHKMVGRLLSDLAAMGAVPDHLLLNLVVPGGTPAAVMESLYRGAEKLALLHGAAIVGGDTVGASPLALHGFAIGHVPKGRAALRSGAREGDLLYVTGKLGGSREGRHLDFSPRVREGLWLREGEWITAMMDLSDGLARDLPRLCQASGVGVDVDVSALPITHDLSGALMDGEDYELLFTVPVSRRATLEQAWPFGSNPSCTCIGVVRKGAGDAQLVHPGGRREPMPAVGFDHMS